MTKFNQKSFSVGGYKPENAEVYICPKCEPVEFKGPKLKFKFCVLHRAELK